MGDKDERVLADVAQHIIARARDLRDVAEEHPAARENLFKLSLVQIRIVKHPRGKYPVGQIGLDFREKIGDRRLPPPAAPRDTVTWFNSRHWLLQ